MIASIKACSFEFDDDGWATISDGAKDLVRHLLVLDPDERFSMAQVLEHPWINGASPAALHASEMPLSPTIHHELAKYREHTKQKVSCCTGYCSLLLLPSGLMYLEIMRFGLGGLTSLVGFWFVRRSRR